MGLGGIGHSCYMNAKAFTVIHRIYAPSSQGGEIKEAQWKKKWNKERGTKKNKNQFNIVTA